MSGFDANRIVDDIVNNERVDWDFLDEFRGCDPNDLIMYHHGFGTWIRNTYGLWQNKWEPVIVDGVDMAEDHPDALSMKVIEALHDRLSWIP